MVSECFKGGYSLHLANKNRDKLTAVRLGKMSLMVEYLGKTSCCFLTCSPFPFTDVMWLQPDVGYLSRLSCLTMNALLILTFLKSIAMNALLFFLVFPSVQQPAASSATAEVQLNFIQANQIQCDTCLVHKHTPALT